MITRIYAPDNVVEYDCRESVNDANVRQRTIATTNKLSSTNFLYCFFLEIILTVRPNVHDPSANSNRNTLIRTILYLLIW